MNGSLNLLTLGQVMEITKLSRITLFRQIKKGKLPAKKFGKQWFVKKETLQEIFGYGEAPA